MLYSMKKFNQWCGSHLEGTISYGKTRGLMSRDRGGRSATKNRRFEMGGVDQRNRFFLGTKRCVFFVIYR